MARSRSKQPLRPVHERVAAHVQAANLTHEELAERMGWTLRKTKRLLKGTTRLTAVHMESLSSILLRPVGELYTDPEARAA